MKISSRFHVFVLATSIVAATVGSRASADAISDCLVRLDEQTVMQGGLHADDIDDEQDELEKLCGEADRVLERQESQVRKYEILRSTVMAQGTLHHIDQFYSKVDAEIAKIHADFESIKNIPIEISDTNTSRARESESRLAKSQALYEEYANKWNQYHLLVKDSVLEQFLALSDPKSGSSDSVIEAVKNLKSTLPKFVLGLEDAPKDKLNQYAEALHKTERFLKLRDAQVARLHSESTQKELGSIARNQARLISAQRYQSLLETSIGTDIVVRVSLYAASGACLMARSDFQEAMRIYEVGYEKAPASIKIDIEPGFQAKMETLRAIEPRVRACEIESHQSRLKNYVDTLRTQLRSKIGLCAQKDPSREFRWLTIDERYVELSDSFIKIKKWTPELRELSQVSLERIWQDSKSLKSQCEGLGVSFL